ncbi:hypothetical protein KGF57_005027 [Candida theae]|uniref:Uncharacterized protein n=1 Tax=Candida theae TaxID=1198502 RepID=A0AAD5BAZ9_9ASCO|nr:uncharacterized protein KGF57_005027 [Candida theae]KAI5948964.1 hypothetical protein KGF57_005027 [Candida theae]
MTLGQFLDFKNHIPETSSNLCLKPTQLELNFILCTENDTSEGLYWYSLDFPITWITRIFNLANVIHFWVGLLYIRDED